MVKKTKKIYKKKRNDMVNGTPCSQNSNLSKLLVSGIFTTQSFQLPPSNGPCHSKIREHVPKYGIGHRQNLSATRSPFLNSKRDLARRHCSQFVAPSRDMGSRASKLQPAVELPPALQPIRRKIEEVKKRRRKRSRRYSIVSTTELLHPDERDAGSSSSRKAEGTEEEEACAAQAQLSKVEEEVQYLTSDEGPEEVYEGVPAKKEVAQAEKKKHEVHTPAPVTKKQTEAAVVEEEGRKLRAVTARRGNGGEELPGSPSFRIYFPGPFHEPDDDPVVILEQLNSNKDGKNPKSGVAHVRAKSKDHSNSNEDSESKGQQGKKAARMRKWRAITKANLAVHHMLNVRNCYSNPEAKHGSSQLIVGKAA